MSDQEARSAARKLGDEPRPDKTTDESLAATTVPWDTIRRLRTHLESEQRYAFVDALDKLGEKACEAEEYAAAFDAMENGIETPKPKVVARGTVKLERVDDA